MMGGGGQLVGKAYLKYLYTLNPLKMTYIERQVELPELAEVVTSGAGGVYPAGIAIGKVIRSREDRSGLYLHASLLPAVDVDHLKQVIVLRNTGGAE